MVSATNPKKICSKTKQLFKAMSSLYAAINSCKKLETYHAPHETWKTFSKFEPNSSLYTALTSCKKLEKFNASICYESQKTLPPFCPKIPVQDFSKQDISQKSRLCHF